MMQWWQSLSQHCIRSHAPEIIPWPPFHAFHSTLLWNTNLYIEPERLQRLQRDWSIQSLCWGNIAFQQTWKNKLKVIRKKGWKYRGRVKSWCSAQYWLKQDVSNVSSLQEGWCCGVCSPHITRHCCLPRQPLLSQSQAPSMPREPACCWHRHLQSGALTSCTSPIDMGCSWYYNISGCAIYTPESSSKGKRGAVLCVCSFLSQE